MKFDAIMNVLSHGFYWCKKKIRNIWNIYIYKNSTVKQEYTLQKEGECATFSANFEMLSNLLRGG